MKGKYLLTILLAVVMYLAHAPLRAFIAVGVIYVTAVVSAEHRAK
jgi:hypothetical protein